MSGYKSIKHIVALLFVCNCVFAFIMPDKYFGVADYYIFLLMITLLGVINSIGKPLIYKEQLVPIILLVTLIIPTFLGVYNEGLQSGYFFSYLLYFTTIFFMLGFDFEMSDISLMIRGYIIAGVVIGLIICFQQVDYYDGSGFRYTIQLFGHEKFDPNFLGAYLVVPLILSCVKFLYTRKMAYIFYSLIIGIGLLMSSSRAAIISFVIGMGIFIFPSLKQGKKSGLIIKALIVGLVFVIVALYVIPQGSFNRIFVHSYVDSSNEKRILDWALGLSAFYGRPFWGFGLMGEMDIIKMSTSYNLISHNTYIAFLLQFGLIGTAIMAWQACSIIHDAYKKKEYIIVSIMISTLMVIFPVSGEVSLFLWCPVMLCLCLSKYANNNGIEKLEILLQRR